MGGRSIVSILVAIALLAHAGIAARSHSLMAEGQFSPDAAFYAGSICLKSKDIDLEHAPPAKPSLEHKCRFCLCFGPFVFVLSKAIEPAPPYLWAVAASFEQPKCSVLGRKVMVPFSRGPPISI